MKKKSMLPKVSVPASKPTKFSGTFTNISSTIAGVRAAGRKRFVDRTVTWKFAEGDFLGTSVAQLTYTFPPNGKVTFSGTETFTGTLDGKSGTFVVPQSASINGTTGQGRFVILSGTGGLANLHGQGTFLGTSESGTWSGKFHFD